MRAKVHALPTYVELFAPMKIPVLKNEKFLCNMLVHNCMFTLLDVFFLWLRSVANAEALLQQADDQLVVCTNFNVYQYYFLWLFLHAGSH